MFPFSGSPFTPCEDKRFASELGLSRLQWRLALLVVQLRSRLRLQPPPLAPRLAVPSPVPLATAFLRQRTMALSEYLSPARGESGKTRGQRLFPSGLEPTNMWYVARVPTYILYTIAVAI